MMVAIRAVDGWRGRALAAWAMLPLLMIGLLLLVCAVDVPGDQPRHDVECSIEQASAAAPAPATAPIPAVNTATETRVVVPGHWYSIAAPCSAYLRGYRASPQQPRAPPSLAIS